MKTVSKENTHTVLSILVFVLGISMLSQVAKAFDYPAEGNYADGAKTWADNCARCHNMRSPNELRDDQWITTVFHMRVRAGLTGQETRDILTFLQASNTSVPAAVKPSSVSLEGAASQSGKAIYGKTCTACHGDNGKGTLPGVPDFTQRDGRLSKSDAVLFNNIWSGYRSPGSSMIMPPKGGDGSLTKADVNAVLRYIREAFSQ